MAALIDSLRIYLQSPQGQQAPAPVKRVMLKEYLQGYILAFIYNHDRYRRLRFYGGTAARLLYGLNRLSEDLDLDNSEQVEMERFAGEIREFLVGTWQLPAVTITTQIGEFGVRRWTVKLPILGELGLGSDPAEKLHVKVEISNHKQVATTLMTPLLVHGQSFVANHFDEPSLMAGKIIACLERVFQVGKSDILVKGRDYYDLIWYMQRGVKPNEEKLKQDGKEKYTVKGAMKLLQTRVARLSHRQLENDLLPLFENQNFIKVWLDEFDQLFERYLKQYL